MLGGTHDWTVLSLNVGWEEGSVKMELMSADGTKTLNVIGLRDLHVPRLLDWGPSSSINKTDGPLRSNNGLSTISIEMQSGDIITIVAKSFDLT